MFSQWEENKPAPTCKWIPISNTRRKDPNTTPVPSDNDTPRHYYLNELLPLKSQWNDAPRREAVVNMEILLVVYINPLCSDED